MITPDGYRILQQFIQPGMNVLELGDQLCDWSSKVHGQRADIVLKDLHQVDVTTIDIHGNNRALPLNLNEYPCCGDDMHGSFDLVTDFGTMEHTDDIFNCLSNVYLMLKPGGISIHANPAKSYTNHGNYYFTPRFWEKYCEFTGAELLHTETTPVYHKSNPHHELYAVIKHGDKFMNFEQWEDEMMRWYRRW